MTVSFDSDGYPSITVDTKTGGTINTKLSVTTQGGKTASLRFDFIVPQPTTTISLKAAHATSLILAFNAIDDMTVV